MRKLLIGLLLTTGLALLGLGLWANWQNPQQDVAKKHYERPQHSQEAQQQYVQRLSQAVKFKTISSRGDTQQTQQAFDDFNYFLYVSYPKAMAEITLQHTSSNSQLFLLKGTDSSLAPLLLIAHSDVVPAQTTVLKSVYNSTGSGWQHKPFSGHIDQHYIWGRGTLDNKSAVLAMFEALELRVLDEGARSKRDIYIAVTHDEEVGGHEGAKQIAAYLKRQQVRPYFILDEGQAVTQGIVPNVEKPVALIGVSQKGYMTLELSALGEPGHSMMPPKATAISIISKAIDKLTQSPMPAEMTSPIKAMFRELSYEMAFPNNLVLFHTWLTEPLVNGQLQKQPATDALIRSSMSVNVINGGIAENVLPRKVLALINYRIAPHNSSDDILKHVRGTLDGMGVSIKVVSAIEEPAAITDYNHDAYLLVKKTISDIFPDALVAPSITLSTTDSRHFSGLSENIIRFCPIFLKKEDLKRFHGINERISKDNYVQMIDFYGRLMDLN